MGQLVKRIKQPWIGVIQPKCMCRRTERKPTVGIQFFFILKCLSILNASIGNNIATAQFGSPRLTSSDWRAIKTSSSSRVYARNSMFLRVNDRKWAPNYNSVAVVLSMKGVFVGNTFWSTAILENFTEKKKSVIPSPVILWIELGGKPKWLPSNFGHHDVMRTAPTTKYKLRKLVFSHV